MGAVYRKLIAVRLLMRARRVGDVPEAEAQMALGLGATDGDEAEAIFRLTSQPTFEERFVVPPLAREEAVEATLDPYAHKPSTGFGFRQSGERRF